MMTDTPTAPADDPRVPPIRPLWEEKGGTIEQVWVDDFDREFDPAPTEAPE